ncbi:hypothetical protein [Tuwongella immobilis]|uniref:Neutral/alkaline non-lysosomal ceramidase N-terminal domain-containing protein n=1 Tax=Tuwongella immobilis TaxID=692036 RepID=A0A6C2YR64_9BACT|nr:hypothetical protein [Tuwongella immobilis]VIP03831.1 Uncharacterized protein OS=Singulisphaera acidiphila (strain ATCC BAA-1392 / DSM 18658 / VKM B-2454 / MOB10) GN=Sinac_3020 PE=4 SV=1 [Tuwongella immobilis]VTS05029.1 Uncharacterized protein OS=Singulisphaera acidiphila (strain ATCC BAA-1392 / DSM 18658 / VKM B-2454 / MOB10) GN=Sinac_3020 PE=4 SV=1 [Tuwongella immobilis]
MAGLHLSTFTADVTPPLNHPLCGGWIQPVRGVDDPLKAVGVVIYGLAKPVVLCTLDWTGLRNQSHRDWQVALAEAAHTTPDHVAIHTVHPHNAPFADTEAQKLIEAAMGPISLDLEFHKSAIRATCKALADSAPKQVPFTHVGFGSAKVEKVASNRRILGPNGKVAFTRTSATRDPKIRDLPEGLIDPLLRSVSFWNQNKPLAVLSYYATHPMSYYGDGRVSADFCGLARQKWQDEQPGLFQVYFTGCSGNITAGKYNDGSKENRIALRDRIYLAMKAAFQNTKRFPVETATWRVEPVTLPPRAEANFGMDASRAVLNDPKESAARRNNAAYQMAWLMRKDRPIELSCLDFGGKLQLLHLPAESFVEYQLFAQAQRPDSFVCVAAYGDDGPGYIPLAEAYPQGGYEPTVALVAPESEAILKAGIRKLLLAEKGTS